MLICDFCGKAEEQPGDITARGAVIDQHPYDLCADCLVDEHMRAQDKAGRIIRKLDRMEGQS